MEYLGHQWEDFIKFDVSYFSKNFQKIICPYGIPGLPMGGFS
jgi:hypothetical protein